MELRTSSLPQIVCAAGVAGLLVLALGCKRAEPGTYATPAEAIQALNAIIGTRDSPQTEVMFGPGSVDIFRSGDDAADRDEGARVKKLLNEKVAFEVVNDTTQVALFGEKAWPFPIPLVKTGERWRFDTAAGREELLNRRIGYNELSTLASLHAYVDAQFEYRSQGRDGKSPAFAQHVKSSEGLHDGLYWPAAEGEEPSPLGDLLAGAATVESSEPTPFQGYYFRLLTSQGKSAPGGARSFLNAKGALTGGFAAIAWPAKYGNSGVMTFLVSQRDIVFQKDLGPESAKAAATIESFDPDESWDATGDSMADVDDDGADDAGTADAPPPGAN